MMPQKHTPLQSFPFDIRTVEKRCSYVNTISINLALIKQKRNSDVANILDTYVKNRHLFANSAPWAGNVSDNEKSGNFPPAPRKPADPARSDFGCSAGRRVLTPPCKRIVPTTITQKKNHPSATPDRGTLKRVLGLGRQCNCTVCLFCCLSA